MIEAKKSYDHLVKIMLLGDSGVGKSCLLLRFIDDTFSTSYMSTIGIDFKVKTVTIDGVVIKLQIWDTAGQERYSTITRSYYRSAMGVMLVYDITNIASFENVNKWLNRLDIHGDSDAEKMLVGNKLDLEERRAVHSDYGNRLATEKKIPFIEVSAQNAHNVDLVFHTLTRSIIRRHNLVTYNSSPNKCGPNNGNQAVTVQPSPDRSSQERKKRHSNSKLKLRFSYSPKPPAKCCK